MTILISQTISKLTHKKSRIHVFKYDLEKKYKMNKIKTFIKAKIMQIPNYINRLKKESGRVCVSVFEDN